ncbi:hypothetical protein AtDm6_2215 [Acetobacter tropicalis]|uniref:Uncharacterized protein n=1 Tax=Acetobacter tropicalis TaxID=104102 RepID=A0A094YPV1_9PROT|nr:hypothetical protein AtDm6_2215 [Acetobacter tropicalis]
MNRALPKQMKWVEDTSGTLLFRHLLFFFSDQPRSAERRVFHGVL